MQENESIENASGQPSRPGQHRRDPQSSDGATVVRHRFRPDYRGRLPYLAATLAAAAGLAVAGVATATTRDGDRRDAPVAAADERARADAADRANRSGRDTPTRPPTTDPTSGASTGSPSTGTPDTPRTTPKRTAKPEPAEPAKPAARSAEQEKETADWVHPMPGAATTSCFGQRWGVLHAGIDLAMPADTPIRAAADGTVVEAGWVYAGYGISVVIDHGDGFLTHYAHQNRTAVAVGQQVDAGEVIGYEGSTGDSTGPHLHFEVHNGLWNQLDPAPWMRERGVNLGC